MSTIYTGSPVLSNSITIPVDGDNANALSVNVSSKALMDMQAFLLQTYGQVQQSTSPIRMFYAGANIITLRPVPAIVVSETGVWKTIFTTTNTSIGVANVEGGGAYVANTWYYIYAYSVAGVFTIQLSTTSPDVYQLYKDGGTFTYKFLGSFKTDNMANIISFSKYGEYVQYSEATTLSGGGFANASQTTIGTAVYLPTYKTSPTTTKLLITVNKTDIGANNLHLITNTGTNGIVIPLYVGYYTVPIDVATDATRNVYWKTDFSTLLTDFTFELVGYNE